MKVKGGLGNQMFQYALGRNLSLNNTNLKLDIIWFNKIKSATIIPREYGLRYFNIEENFATEKQINKIKDFQKYLSFPK